MRTITEMGLHNSHSIMGANARFLYNAYEMNASSVGVLWKERCDVEDNLIRVSS